VGIFLFEKQASGDAAAILAQATSDEAALRLRALFQMS
jgi:hypothetical protein